MHSRRREKQLGGEGGEICPNVQNKIFLYVYCVFTSHKKGPHFQVCPNIFTFARITLGLGIHLFVKVPRPGDSEVTSSVFESSCHLLLPV